MKKVRCKKEYGIWYYKKILPNNNNDLNTAVYELYNDKTELVYTCSYYSSLIYYIQTGVELE